MEAVLGEFRAGKLKLQAGQLVADPRKGLVRLVQTEDTLVHVQWYERTAAGPAAAPEDDVIVFPGEAVLEKLPGQRALLLKFPDDRSRDMFFWIQEPKADGDDALVTAFNGRLNHVHDAEVAEESAMAASEMPGVTGITPSSALEHAHVASEAGAGAMMGVGGSLVQLPSAPAQTPASAAAVNTQANNLAAILGNAIAASLGGGAAPAYGAEEQLAHSLLAQLAAAQGGRHRAMAAPGPSLAEVLRPDVMSAFLRDPTVLAALAPHLPEEQRTTEALVSLAHSPQFRQQLSAFSAALQSGQLDLSQFGLRAAGYSVADFLTAIQELVERERREGGGGQQGGGGQGGGGAPMEH
ncbi:hypothetical protein GPECTOR_63g29 [Gonium pectorale]|uniref:Uncharacterized protein n=1 Tax=Gonium pectorale TaxID=33097 RepID=A0A150G4F5_GONPE|nr:hypothetical protein GPECTOR_63g29 [Gonium pectorale]|eukprot:KXZ44701.1 hypothetical protein GPECTOR_63g29 [Gonium pectorale]